ncbi:OmpA family protein [Fluviibacterium sp. S390]|uniref:OmpA family protein n=1 Tax=Fluviibacterium sp. S390 TaxID=3415139 RepID=UPI003C7BD5C6
MKKPMKCIGLAGLMAMTSMSCQAQNIIEFDELGNVIETPSETDIISVELPTREWIDPAPADQAWVFVEAETPEVEWANTHNAGQVTAEHDQLAVEIESQAPASVVTETPAISSATVEAKQPAAKAVGRAPHIEVATVQPTTIRPPAENPAPPKMEDLLKQNKVLVFRGIKFDYDKTTLRPEAMPTINKIADALKRDPSLSVAIEGHTDGRGSDAYNLALSQRRAEAVVNALVSIHGIDRERLTPIGVGEAEPMATNDTEVGRQENRRVVVRNSSG